MNYRQMRNIHRWIFTLTGIFMVTWLLSGVLMAIPFDSAVWHKNSPTDYGRAVLSPADAVVNLVKRSSEPVEVKSVRLRQVNERLLYSLVLADGSERQIDAANGQSFTFTPELAESIIRSNFNITAPLAKAEHLTEHSTVYPWGSLPAYRMTFTDSDSVSYFLVESDLKVFRSTPVTRLRTAITSLHEFGPVNFLTSDSRVRKGLLIMIAGIALVGAIAGVLMTLPRRRS